MLTLLVPILVNFLIEPASFRTSTKYRVQLHDQSLQWLMKIGPKYPQVNERNKKLKKKPRLKTKFLEIPGIQRFDGTVARNAKQIGSCCQEPAAATTG